MPDLKDATSPELIKQLGGYHPINQIKDSVMNLLGSYGFEIINGPEIETEEFNFDMLNIKKSHPARQMHDTFYVNKKSNVLRTHTSPVQIRGMLEKKPPFAFISGGKVYRKDDDATHLPMFHQIEGMYVDENVNFANLILLDFHKCDLLILQSHLILILKLSLCMKIIQKNNMSYILLNL